MGAVREYLLSITAAVLVCSIVRFLMGEKSATGKLIKLICSLFLAATVLAPLLTFRFDDMIDMDELGIDENSYVEEGKQMAQEAMKDIIKTQLEAYIYHEAQNVSANLKVEVFLRNDASFLPGKVVMTGAVSPYQKKVLSEYMETTLGISRENQVWT